MHEIYARFRLALGFGDPSLVTNVTIANDTGSNLQTIFDTDLANLNCNINAYPVGLNPVFTAGGIVQRRMILIQMQILQANGDEVSPWFEEKAVITPVLPGATQCRLSGNEMRNHLFFATALGNASLFVAQSRNGILIQL